jgi:dipeptidyl aminopeptidase/acylaminoacyl peptidase
MNSPIRQAVSLAFLIAALGILLPYSYPLAQEEAQKADKETPPPMTQDGKHLLTALDALKIKGVGSPALSPDGGRVAYTVSQLKMEEDEPWSRITQIWVVPSKGGTARQFTRGEKSASGPQWSPDGKYLAFLSNRGEKGEQQVWFMWADGGEAWEVTHHKGGVGSFRFSPDAKKLLFTALDQPSKDEEERKKAKDDTILIDRDFKMTHLWIWNIEKEEEKRLTEGDFTCSDPRWSPDGNRISFTTRPTPKADDGGITDLWVVTVATGEKKKLVENPGSDSGARWSPDGQWIAYIGNATTNSGVNPSYLYLVSSEGGMPRKLTASFELDPGTPVWSRDGKTIYFSTATRQHREIFSCSVDSGTVEQITRTGGTIGLSGGGFAGDTVVGTISSPHKPTSVFSADIGFKSIERITHQNSWLEDYALGDVEILKWTSKDGMEIEGVLTKPVGFDPNKKYPLLLNPHGGPTGASMTGFNSTGQLMAANGYMVLQPNFRGSVGRGAEFAAANKNSWGKGDYEDCMTGVDAVIDKGWADPNRLGAFGWSYGGYMTFWILTQTDRFKAVSPGAGLTNIYSMYSQNDIQRYLRWFYDDKSPWDNVNLYWDRSPMRWIKQVKTPTMIMHGQNDTRVPIAQAQEFYRALVEMNVPVEFVVFPREGHGIREPIHALDRMQRYLAFFGMYLDNPSVTESEETMKAKTPTR